MFSRTFLEYFLKGFTRQKPYIFKDFQSRNYYQWVENNGILKNYSLPDKKNSLPDTEKHVNCSKQCQEHPSKNHEYLIFFFG